MIAMTFFSVVFLPLYSNNTRVGKIKEAITDRHISHYHSREKRVKEGSENGKERGEGKKQISI